MSFPIGNQFSVSSTLSPDPLGRMSLQELAGSLGFKENNFRPINAATIAAITPNLINLSDQIRSTGIPAGITNP